jgi:hypothetical protein
MLRTIAYIIFLCTGIFAFTLIVLFFRDQSGFVSSRTDTTQGTTTGGSAPVETTARAKDVIARIDRAYNFNTSQQKDIFGAFIFQFAVDSRVGGGLRMYVFEDEYSLVRKNMLLLGALYNFQDTTDFFGKTMYLNEKNADGQFVRFITDVNGTTFGFELVRDEYEKLKGLLLQ